MMESNITELINQTYGSMNLTANGTLNGTPINLDIVGSFTSPPIPYQDFIFGMLLVDTIILIFLLVLVFFILIKRNKVIL